VQDGAFLYLDPHEVQAAVRPAAPPAAAAAAEAEAEPRLAASQLASYFCDTVRLLPAASLDPSMALGFLCRGAGRLRARAKGRAGRMGASPGQGAPRAWLGPRWAGHSSGTSGHAMVW
jgi:hypothetical protein